jgi:hypothetical protein
MTLRLVLASLPVTGSSSDCTRLTRPRRLHLANGGSIVVRIGAITVVELNGGGVRSRPVAYAPPRAQGNGFMLTSLIPIDVEISATSTGAPLVCMGGNRTRP